MDTNIIFITMQALNLPRRAPYTLKWKHEVIMLLVTSAGFHLRESAEKLPLPSPHPTLSTSLRHMARKRVWEENACDILLHSCTTLAETIVTCEFDQTLFCDSYVIVIWIRGASIKTRVTLYYLAFLPLQPQFY